MAKEKENFWQRRIVAPVRAQLLQGVTPEKIALALGVSVTCGLFPFIGFTTLLCFLAAAVLRLNQPIVHVVNQLLWPAQVLAIPLFIKVGALLYGAESIPFDPVEVARIFAESQREFWARFGLAGFHALTAWLIAAPAMVWLVRAATLPSIRALHQRLNAR